MTVTTFVAFIAPRTGKIIKNGFRMFTKEERICFKMVYTFCVYVQPIVRIVLES